MVGLLIMGQTLYKLNSFSESPFRCICFMLFVLWCTLLRCSCNKFLLIDFWFKWLYNRAVMYRSICVEYCEWSLPTLFGKGGSSQSHLFVPHPCRPSLFVLIASRGGMASLLSCASYLGRFPIHSTVVLKLLFLIGPESGAPLSSSGLEEAL